MLSFLSRLGSFLLARSQERSSVGGAVMVLSSLLGVSMPAGTASAIVSAVMAVGGLIAMLVPGGK